MLTLVALLRRRCDLMIHNANEFTAKHKRFLLSGFALGLRALGAPGAGPSSDPDHARLAGGAGARSPLLSSGGLSTGAGSSMSDPQLLHTHSCSGGRMSGAAGLPGGSLGVGAGEAWAGADGARGYANTGKAQMTAAMKAQAEEAQRELREAQREVRCGVPGNPVPWPNHRKDFGSSGAGGGGAACCTLRSAAVLDPG